MVLVRERIAVTKEGQANRVLSERQLPFCASRKMVSRYRKPSSSAFHQREIALAAHASGDGAMAVLVGR